MDTQYYIVIVQDYGEVYEYEFPDLDKARCLMNAERLPCSLWECNAHSSTRRKLDSRNTARKLTL